MISSKRHYEKLGTILSELFYDSYAAYPEFLQMIGGCRNSYSPAIQRGLGKLIFRHSKELPLREREYLMKIEAALREKRLEEAVSHGLKAHKYSSQLGFASVNELQR